MVDENKDKNLTNRESEKKTVSDVQKFKDALMTPTASNYKSTVVVDRGMLEEGITGDDAMDEEEMVEFKSLRENTTRLLNQFATRDFTDRAENVFDAVKELRELVGAPKVGSAAIKWVRTTIKALHELQDISVEEKFIRDDKRIFSTRSFKKPGEMFMFSYVPKTRTTLNYYDTFPCVYILEMYQDGFLGINFHYLPLNLRERLFLRLQKFRSGDYKNKKTRLVLKYKKLINTPRIREFLKPCIKRYYYKRMDSYLLRIPPEDWYIAVFLPLSRFKKAHRQLVYRNSRLEISRDRLNRGREEDLA